jgi:RNA polymerase primary sigma factor
VKNGEAGIKRIKELIEKGRSKGVLTYKEIMDMLEEIDLEPDQIEKVYIIILHFYLKYFSNFTP